MLVLGFNCSRLGHEESPYAHDAAAAIVRDGEVIAAAEEERFNRHKHSGQFPRQAIEYCLRAADASLTHLDRVCFFWDPALDHANMIAAPVDVMEILNRHAPRLTIPDQVFKNFQHYFGFPVDTRIRRFVPHHLCHAASSFFCSGYESAAFLVVDAYGEMTSITTGVADHRTFSVLQQTTLPTSPGVFYNAVTRLLGFYGRDDEFKVMGLAAFGRPERFREQFASFWKPTDDGLAQVGCEESRASAIGLARFRRDPGEPITQDHMDVAAALQEAIEEQILYLARRLRVATNQKNLCLAGGVAQNSVANGKLARSGLFDRIFVQPASHDAGTALGAALYECSVASRHPPKMRKAFSPFLGPAFGQDEIDQTCASYRAEIVVSRPEHLASEVAQSLAAGHVVAWFQGRMEFGPRALGARSILADPRQASMRDKVNSAIKHREPFRPFAPIVLAECLDTYFEVPAGIDPSLMVFTVPARRARRHDIAAVVHTDGTSRVQSVSRAANERLWGVLVAFGQLTGVPVLMNTSFNVNGEPIVCSPQDAIECFLSTSIDVLVIGDAIVTRRPVDDAEWLAARPVIQEGTDVHTAFVSSGTDPDGLNHRVTVRRRHRGAAVQALAAEVLLHCNGEHSIKDLIQLFVDAMDRDEAIAELVQSTLRQLLELRVLRLVSAPAKEALDDASHRDRAYDRRALHDGAVRAGLAGQGRSSGGD